jgi:hypothetical protein
LKDLFGISGVIQVGVDEKLIVVSKAPSAHWEAVQFTAKQIIADYIAKRREKAASK